MQVMDKVKLIESMDNLDSVWEAFVPLAKELGFDYVVYTISSNDNHDFFYYDNFGLHPKDEKEFYDPFLEFCCHSYETTFTGVEFSELHADFDLPPKAIKVMARASDLGMISGIGIPLRLTGSNRYGGFNLGTGLKRESFEKLCEEIENSAQVVCMLVHRKIEQILDQCNIMVETKADTSSRAETWEGSKSVAKKLANLTPKEKDIINKIANGFSRKRCADSLFVSESTVSTHMKNIYRKLGVHNRVQATNIVKQHANVNLSSPK